MVSAAQCAAAFHGEAYDPARHTGAMLKLTADNGAIVTGPMVNEAHFPPQRMGQ